MVDLTALAFTKDPVAGGAGTKSSALEVGDGNAPGRLRARESYGAESLNRFIGHNIAAASTAKTDGWAGYAAAPVETHDPHVIGSMAAHLVLPWIPGVLQFKGWARGSITGCAPSTCKGRFRFNRRRTRHAAARCSHRRPFTYNMLSAGMVHKRFCRNASSRPGSAR